jgi:hypothetical protein
MLTGLLPFGMDGDTSLLQEDPSNEKFWRCVGTVDLSAFAD